MNSGSASLVQMDEYFRDLGRFVHVFSESEYRVRQALTRTVNIPAESGKAIFSGTRTNEAVSHIRRLHESHGVRINPELEEALSHLLAISKIRNEILHSGALWGGENMIVTNASSALPKSIRTFKLTLGDMADMTADLGKINGLLMVYVLSVSKRVPKAVVEAHRHAWLAPWRYIPPEASKDHKAQGHDPKRPKRAPKRPAQPEASKE